MICAKSVTTYIVYVKIANTTRLASFPNCQKWLITTWRLLQQSELNITCFAFLNILTMLQNRAVGPVRNYTFYNSMYSSEPTLRSADRVLRLAGSQPSCLAKRNPPPLQLGCARWRPLLDGLADAKHQPDVAEQHKQCSHDAREPSKDDGDKSGWYEAYREKQVCLPCVLFSWSWSD